ncbi:MAG: CBS domain-containing protein [Polyangiaceae bacterium]
MPKTIGPLTVSALMTRGVYALSPTQSLPLAEALMGLRRIRHVPVVDETGAFVGLVTHRDLLQAQLSALTPLSAEERSSLQLAIPVSKIMQTNVWTIRSDALAATAARTMREHRYGCLPVVDDGKLVGILTEADLVGFAVEVLEGGAETSVWSVARAMTPSPVTIDRHATIAEARALMHEHRVRHLPFVEHGRAVGITSDRDLRMAEALFHDSPETTAWHAAGLVGTEEPHKVSPDDQLEAVLVDMFKELRDAVLVVRGDELVGILAASDACRILAERLRSGRPH